VSQYPVIWADRQKVIGWPASPFPPDVHRTGWAGQRPALRCHCLSLSV